MKPHPSLPHVFIDTTMAEGYTVTVDTQKNTIKVEHPQSFVRLIEFDGEIRLSHLTALCNELEQENLARKSTIIRK